MGRPSKGDEASRCKIEVRVTPAQLVTYLSLDGANGLRAYLREAAASPSTPEAHAPFPPTVVKRNGRPPKYGEAMPHRSEVRLTTEQRDILQKLGGQDFLRGVLRLAIARDSLKAKP